MDKYTYTDSDYKNITATEARKRFGDIGKSLRDIKKRRFSDDGWNSQVKANVFIGSKVGVTFVYKHFYGVKI